jgi:hypothetical protein
LNLNHNFDHHHVELAFERHFDAIDCHIAAILILGAFSVALMLDLLDRLLL